MEAPDVDANTDRKIDDEFESLCLAPDDDGALLEVDGPGSALFDAFA